jgi:hypothetical protein
MVCNFYVITKITKKKNFEFNNIETLKSFKNKWKMIISVTNKPYEKEFRGISYVYKDCIQRIDFYFQQIIMNGYYKYLPEILKNFEISHVTSLSLVIRKYPQ